MLGKGYRRRNGFKEDALTLQEVVSKGTCPRVGKAHGF